MRIMVTTNEMIETIRLPKRNKSPYVTIGNAPFRGQDLTAYRLRFTLHKVIISTSDRFCNCCLPEVLCYVLLPAQ